MAVLWLWSPSVATARSLRTSEQAIHDLALDQAAKEAHSYRNPFRSEHMPMTGVTDMDTAPIGACCLTT